MHRPLYFGILFASELHISELSSQLSGSQRQYLAAQQKLEGLEVNESEQQALELTQHRYIQLLHVQYR